MREKKKKKKVLPNLRLAFDKMPVLIIYLWDNTILPIKARVQTVPRVYVFVIWCRKASPHQLGI